MNKKYKVKEGKVFYFEAMTAYMDEPMVGVASAGDEVHIRGGLVDVIRIVNNSKVVYPTVNYPWVVEKAAMEGKLEEIVS